MHNAETVSRAIQVLNLDVCHWRAGCGENRTSGSEGADGKVLRATGVTRRRPTLPLTQKVREDGRIVNVSVVVVATAVNGEGKREIIGMDVGTSEDGAFWLAFLRSLSARGLGGVELVVSDAHQGLRGAIAAVFGGASWQRCRTHFMTNLLTRVPRRAQPWVATMVRTI